METKEYNEEDDDILKCPYCKSDSILKEEKIEGTRKNKYTYFFSCINCNKRF